MERLRDQKARRTRSFRAGVQSAPAEGRFWPSMYWRRIVIGAPPHGPHKIAWRPQVTLALADPPERRDSREFLLHAPRRDAFEAVHQLGQAHLRRIVDQQVYVVGSPLNCFSTASKSVQTDRNISSRRLMRAASNTFPRRLVTNTKCA